MHRTGGRSGMRPEEIGEDTDGLLARLDATARRAETPCGEGSMVWRLWDGMADGAGIGAGSAAAGPDGGDRDARPAVLDPVLGPVLVLLHGGSGSWRHWARNIGPLLAAGNRLLVPDLPGLGESAMPPGEVDPANVAAVLAEGIDRLLGADARYDLAGFSFGAVCAGHVAAIRPGRLRSVTIVGAGSLGLERSVTHLVKVRSEHGAAREAAHRHNLAALMIADPARIDPLALRIQELNTVQARLRSRGFASTARLRQALERSDAPLNAIWGEQDAIARNDLPARLRVVREIQPGADVRVIPGAGHWVAYEAAEAFNAMLSDMLRRRRAAR
ncbi:alpha/beta fold hydrolase [Roseomonas sp. NAR14]|uniref:Alpha/beta fold hydrolase n=1 Tax=Roseomonas acroporae TaxID=2937791 RepID=A0A9X1Y630_9PROT|nr:alpha/beta fold hydrolase [Roseomonas acroporae]MCK8783802.1 alpha/beta fold hydrolase [Roseomonas acroporae]